MLPNRLLDFERTEDGRIVPRWLGARDEPWLRELVAEAMAAHGLPAGDVDERILEAVVPTARRHRIGRRSVEAVWTVERRRWTTKIDSPVAPSLIRRTLFELAAERPREEALATTAAVLGIEGARIEDLLFADRAHARLLIAPATPSTMASLVDGHNLAVVQTLLGRATEVTATVRTNLRHVVGYSKLLGLMSSFDEADDGATLATFSGPLALFHDTLKYGGMRLLDGFLC